MSRRYRAMQLPCYMIVGLAMSMLAGGTQAASPTMPIGVAKIDITPETPVRMYGYASRKTESQGVAGRLMAKALVFGGTADPPGTAVWLTVDSGSVPGWLRDDVYDRLAEKMPLAPERFLLCNSHNHSGPNLKGMDDIAGPEHEHLAQYARLLADRLERVVLDAAINRQPCQLAFAQGTVSFAANRRVLKDGQWTGFGAVPDAPADHTLCVLRVTRPDGSLVALVANYACHCTTLRNKFMQIHGDWAACAQQFIESDHPGTIAMTTAGCGADSDPYPHGTVALCEQHGRELADEVKRLLTTEWKPVTPSLRACQVIFGLPYHTPPSLDELRKNADRSWTLTQALNKLEKGEALPEQETYRVVTWTFGNDLAMVFFSDEMVVDYALRLEKEFDASRLWISAYTNDVSRYIVSKRLIGEGGYEVKNSLSSLITFGRPETLAPAMEDRIIGVVKDMVPVSFQSNYGENPTRTDTRGTHVLQRQY